MCVECWLDLFYLYCWNTTPSQSVEGYFFTILTRAQTSFHDIMSLSKIDVDPGILWRGLGPVVFAGACALAGYLLFKSKRSNSDSGGGRSLVVLRERDNWSSEVFITLGSQQKLIEGLLLESHTEDNREWMTHSLKVTDSTLLRKLGDHDIPRSSTIHTICGVDAWVFNHEDLVEFVLKQNEDHIELQLQFTRQNDFNENIDHNKTVKLTFSVHSSGILEVDVECTNSVVPKPIDIIPRHNQGYHEQNCYVEWSKGQVYIFVKEDGTLGVSPLSSEKIKANACFTSRHYSGMTRDIPAEYKVFPNGEIVTIQLFQKTIESTVYYVANTSTRSSKKAILTKRAEPIKKTLNERDPRLYYFEKLGETNLCVFMCSCFPKYFLRYDEENGCLGLKEIENPSSLASPGNDDVKFIFRPMPKETSV